MTKTECSPENWISQIFYLVQFSHDCYVVNLSLKIIE